MAFANVAGRAGFVLELDKSQLDRGLPQAEQQFNRATASMAQSASRSGVSVAGQFEGLLGSVRSMRGSAAELEAQLGGIGKASATAGNATATFGSRLAGVGAIIGRGGLYGIGIQAAYQASNELRRSLEQTGASAYTTEGRLRNMGAALMSVDIIGAFKAWDAQPQKVEDLGISAQEAAGRLGALREVAVGNAAALHDMSQAGTNNFEATGKQTKALDQYNKTVKEAGTGNQAFAQQLLEQGRAWADLYNQMRPVLNAALTFQLPGGVSIGGGFQGLRPQPAAIGSVLGPGAQPGQQGPVPVGPTARIDGAIAIASANGDLQTVLQLQTQKRDMLEKRYRNMPHANVQDRTRAYNDWKNAEAAVISTQRQINDQNAAEQKANAASAKAKADAAASQYRAGLSSRQQQLENAYQTALGTPGLADDRAKAARLSAFLGGESRDPRLNAAERADFKRDQITFIRQRTKDVKDVADAAKQAIKDRLGLQEEVLKNDVAAADLSEKNLKRRIAIRRKLLAFYRMEEQDKDLTAEERQAARGNRISTQAEINGLLAGKTAPGSTFDAGDLRRIQFEFLQSLHGITNQFGGNVSADGAQTASNTWRTSKLTEQVVAGMDRLARATAHPGAKYARNVMSEAYGSAGGV